MLFDLSNYRKRLPEGVLIFASGANQETEIRADLPVWAFLSASL